MGNLTRKDRQGILLICIVLLIIVAIPIIRAFLLQKPTLDETTMCPIGGERVRFSVLIDKSDRWDDANAARVRATIDNIQRKVPFEGRLSIYLIHGQHVSAVEEKRGPSVIDLLFDMCNPGGEQECNALYQNCKAMKLTFHDAFEAPLAKLAKSMSLPSQSDSSPLLEAVGTMIKDSHAQDTHLYLISDLMENHFKFRFYDTVPLDDELIREYPLSSKSNVTVRGFQISHRTDSARLIEAVRKVWQGYFEKQGVRAEFEPFFASD